eukprot:gene3531-8311_t
MASRTIEKGKCDCYTDEHIDFHETSQINERDATLLDSMENSINCTKSWVIPKLTLVVQDTLIPNEVLDLIKEHDTLVRHSIDVLLEKIITKEQQQHYLSLQVSELEALTLDFQETETELKQLVQRLRSKLSEQEAQLSILQFDSKRYQEENRRLNTECSDLTSKLESMKANCKKKDDTNRSLSERLDEVSEQLRLAQIQIQETNTKLDNAVNKLKTEQTSNERLRQELQESYAQIPQLCAKTFRHYLLPSATPARDELTEIRHHQSSWNHTLARERQQHRLAIDDLASPSKEQHQANMSRIEKQYQMEVETLKQRLTAEEARTASARRDAEDILRVLKSQRLSEHNVVGRIGTTLPSRMNHGQEHTSDP